MPDLTRPDTVIDGVAFYRKTATATKAHICDGCFGVVKVGQKYARIQLVHQRPGEDLLRNASEAHSVDYSRRVVLKAHLGCEGDAEGRTAPASTDADPADKLLHDIFSHKP